jgi:hypothetical protein
VIKNTELNSYWKWEESFSPELCDILLKERNSFEELKAVINGGIESQGVLNENIRKSNVCWAPVNHWAEGILYNYGLYATQDNVGNK